MDNNRGRVTIPTDLDVIKETLDIMKEWGADVFAIVMEQSFRRN